MSNSDDAAAPGTAVPRVTLAGALTADVIPGVLFALALAFLTIRLHVPEQYVFDEVYHAYTAGQYAAGNHDAYVWYTKSPREGVAYMWNHPPAGLLFMSAGILVWGDNAFGWRFGSAVFGAAGIVLTYLLALSLTRRRSVAIVAAALLLVDGLYVVESRIGMLDIYGTVFMLGALFALHAYLTSPPDRVRGPLLRLGLLLGLAIGTKWNAGYPSLIIGIVALARGFNLWRRAPHPWRDPAVRAHLVWVPLGLVVLPALVYVTVYIPFFLAGHGFGELVELQRQIFRYHTQLKATHAYQSPWWQWPLTIRPVWYYVAHRAGTVTNIYANGNTVLYWAFIPAVCWVASGWWKRRDPATIVLLIGFFGQWLPWALVPRIAFIYHFLPAATFGCLAIACVLVELFGKGVKGRAVATAYAVLVIGFFAYFYPIYTAIPITRGAFENRMWFSSWR